MHFLHPTWKIPMSSTWYLIVLLNYVLDKLKTYANGVFKIKHLVIEKKIAILFVSINFLKFCHYSKQYSKHLSPSLIESFDSFVLFQPGFRLYSTYYRIPKRKCCNVLFALLMIVYLLNVYNIKGFTRSVKCA